MSIDNDIIQAIKAGDIVLLEKIFSQHSEELGKILEWGSGKFNGFALHCAAYYNQPGVVKFLVEREGANVNQQKKVGNEWTPLHHAETEAYEAAAMLLRLGANPLLQASDGQDTAKFCQSKEVQMLLLLDPGYQKKQEQKEKQARQEKIAGTWTRTTPKEVVHDYALPDSHYQLTDIFNFDARFWREIVKDDKSIAPPAIVFFDDMADKEILYQALKELKELGGDADETVIDGSLLRNKSFLSKPS